MVQNEVEVAGKDESMMSKCRTLAERLGRHPPHRQLGLVTQPVVVFEQRGPRHPEVADLDFELGVEQAVPRGQVAVHKPVRVLNRPPKKKPKQI